MKHPILCLFMICVFTLLMAQPFASLNAAELWNSKSGASKSDGSYYNKRKKSGDSGNTIYNRKNLRGNVHISKSGLRSSMDAYKKMKMGRSQTTSKLWSKMSTSALKNRQGDINLALEREYSIRKNTTSMMVSGAKQRAAERRAGEKAHGAALDKFYAAKEAKKAKRLAMKQRALQGGSRAFSGSKRSYRSTKERRSGIQKPRKLFNDSRN